MINPHLFHIILSTNKFGKDERGLSNMQFGRHLLNEINKKSLNIENIENNPRVLLNYCQIG